MHTTINYHKRVHGGFRVVRDGQRYMLVDTDSFNDWLVRGPFPNRKAAVDWAWEAWEFKTGKRMTLRPSA